MILYYSSTGNSYHVALEIYKKYPGELIDMAKIKTEEPFVLADGEPLFIVTFNCFWGVSEFVEDFFRRHQFVNVKRILAILTCGAYLGSGDAHLNRILRSNGLPEAEVYDLPMVTNYVILHELPPFEEQQECLNEADRRLKLILDGSVSPYRSSFRTRLFGKLVHPLYFIFRHTKLFKVNESCIACGKCVRDCPVKAIEMVNNRPVWQKKTCDHCLKCLHHCPVVAINYGHFTLNKKRYHYPGKCH